MKSTVEDGCCARHFIITDVKSSCPLFLCELFLCAGGFNGTRRLSSIERYDPDTEEWRPLPPMLNARSNFAMTVSEA